MIKETLVLTAHAMGPCASHCDAMTVAGEFIPPALSRYILSSTHLAFFHQSVSRSVFLRS